MTMLLPHRRGLLAAPRTAQYWSAGGRTGLNVSLDTGHSGAVYNVGTRRLVRNSGAALTNLFARFANWYWDGSTAGELATGNPILVRASIEYPIGGALFQMTLNGATDMVIQSGQTIQTDKIAGLTIPAGALYYVHQFISNTVSGTSYNSLPQGRAYIYYDGSNGGNEKYARGSTVTDQTGTLGGQSSTPSTAPANLYQPLVIAGTPVVSGTLPPSFAIFGDSISFGFDEDQQQRVSDSYRNAGPWERWIGGVGGYGYTNLSRSGAKASGYAGIAGGTFPLIWNATKDCFSHAIVALGRNDIGTYNAAQIQASVERLVGFLVQNKKRVWVSTITPLSSSTDGYVTTTNQTADASTDRTAFNAVVRANAIAQASGCLDLADRFESARDSGKWRCDGAVAFASTVTGSGLHPKSIANSTAASEFASPSGVFV
jgi:hypothetical protein